MKRAAGRLGILSLLALTSSCGEQARIASDEASAGGIPRSRSVATVPADVSGKEALAKDPAAERQPTLPVRAADSLSPSMIIRTGQAEIEVDSLEPAITQVETLTRRVGGLHRQQLDSIG